MARANSIFRYPGGKTKAMPFITPFWEYVEHTEYREPFVGGGSVFIAKPLAERNWINDLDEELVAFYEIISAEKTREQLIKELLKIKINKDLYTEMYFSKPRSKMGKAKRSYVLNRCSFSGIMIWNAFIGDVRFNVERAQHAIRLVGEKLQGTKITKVDFEDVINAKPEKKGGKVFLFLDPPYVESRQVAAYKHAFALSDHQRLAKTLKQTSHPFLLTYDDCDFTRENYKWANLYRCTWTYSVANSRVHHNPREKGNELFISNIPLSKKEAKYAGLEKL